MSRIAPERRLLALSLLELLGPHFTLRRSELGHPARSKPFRLASLVVLGDPVGELDDDGTVGILDLLTLLANWGACA